MSQKKVIKLTACRWDDDGKIKIYPIIIGVDSIIDVKPVVIKTYQHSQVFDCYKIESRGAMVSTNYVIDSVEEIYNLINEK
jgi:hypothetical protein